MIQCAEVTKNDKDELFLTVKSIRLQKTTTIKLNNIIDPEQREIFLAWAEETWEAI